MLESASLFSVNDRVLIKPNYVGSKLPSTGAVTDTQVVSTVIRFLKNRGVHDIVVGDGGCWDDTKETFNLVGIKQLAHEERVELVDLNTDIKVNVEIPHASIMKKVRIAKTPLECDSIINIPKMKVHELAGVTLSMKNLMGIISPAPGARDRATIMHDRLAEKLVDFASYIKPVINIIDGSVGMEGSAWWGNAVPMDVIVGGRDMVAVDAIGAYVMGIDPRNIEHIRLASERGLGTLSMRSIDVIGEIVEDVRRTFRPPDLERYHRIRRKP